MFAPNSGGLQNRPLKATLSACFKPPVSERAYPPGGDGDLILMTSNLRFLSERAYPPGGDGDCGGFGRALS